MNKKTKTITVINWQTGEPEEIGMYLTIRQCHVNGHKRISLNYWSSADIGDTSKSFPKAVHKGWNFKSPDASDIIAWCRINDIKLSEPIDKEELDKLASDFSIIYHNQQSNLTLNVVDGVLLKDSVAKAFKAGYCAGLQGSTRKDLIKRFEILKTMFDNSGASGSFDDYALKNWDRVDMNTFDTNG